MKILNSITEAIGSTPIIKLNRFGAGLPGEIYVKLESMNPNSSVKDRVGLSMIEDGEKKGLINSETLIVEPTSGNTGIGLAAVAASRGYRMQLTMPETMSIERRKLLKAFGAEIILTSGAEGMAGAIAKAEQIVTENSNAFMPQQFTNPANPAMHRRTTAQEILDDTDGDIDFFISAVGTGGTITGIGEVLKEKINSITIVAVEPEDSPVLSGGKAGPHKIQGIGAGFVPEVLNTEIIDVIEKVSSDDAGRYARLLPKQEGILVGISAGAALACAVKIASREENRGKKILALLPDSGERYLSTWLFEEQD